MPRSRRRRRRTRYDGAALLAAVCLLGGGYLWVRDWYLRNQADVDAVLSWAVPAAIAVCVLLACLLVRRRLRDAKAADRWRTSRRRVASQQAAVRPPAEIDPDGELPPREYLYRAWGWWQDPDDPKYPDGTWYPDVLLYIGRSNDFLRRDKQHDIDSWWKPNAVRSSQEFFDSYVGPDGRVVTAHQQLVAAERHAIQTERPKHNIVHNGELGRRERLLREQIRLHRDQVA